MSSSPLFGVAGLLTDALLVAGGIVMLVAIGRSRPEVRRRVVILLLPVAATMAVVGWTFGGFLTSSPRFTHLALTAPQWAALLLVPLLGFMGGLYWLGRYERFLSSLTAK